jgi:hypothetical protein
VTADDKTRAYYTAVKFTATATEFVNNEYINFPDGSFSFVTEANAFSSPGTYAIAVSEGTATAANYYFVFKDGTLTVTESDIGTSTDIAANAGGPYTYKGSAHEPLPVVTDTDPFSIGSRRPMTLGTDYEILGYDNNINAGTATVTIRGINNYTGTLTIEFEIRKATLTVTADDIDRPYKKDNPPLTATVTGFVGDDTQSLIMGSFLLGTAANALSPAGEYVISVSRGTADAGNNYTFEFISGTLTVTGMDIGTSDDIMAFVNGTFTYTGRQHTPSGNAVIVTDDWKLRTLLTEGKDYELSYDNNINAGVNTASVTIHGIGNYTGTLTVHFTINKAVLTVTADDKTKTPDAPDPKFTATVIGFVNNENVSVISGWFLLWIDEEYRAFLLGMYEDERSAEERSADENSIISQHIIWISTGTAHADNYEFRLVNGTLTIAEKDPVPIIWVLIAMMSAAVLLLFYMLAHVRYRVVGLVTCKGKGLDGVTIEYTMNGRSGTAVTDSDGYYLIRALAGSEVMITVVEKEGYVLSGALPEPFLMEKTADVDMIMDKV